MEALFAVHSWLIFALLALGTIAMIAVAYMARSAEEVAKARLALISVVLLAVPAAAVLFFILKDGATQANLIEFLVVAVYTGVISVFMGVAAKKLNETAGR